MHKRYLQKLLFPAGLLLVTLLICVLPSHSLTGQDKVANEKPAGARQVAYRTIDGNPLDIIVGEDNSFQIFSAQIPGPGQIYWGGSATPADMGVFVRFTTGPEINDLCSPNFPAHYNSWASNYFNTGTNNLFWTPVSLSPVLGTGTTNDPWTVTVVTRTQSCLELTEVVKYVDGDNYFVHGFTFNNIASEEVCFDAYLGSGFKLAGALYGVPYKLPGSSSIVGGQDCPDLDYHLLHIPLSPAMADRFTAMDENYVWQQISSGDLNNGILPANCTYSKVHTAAALQWKNLCIGPGESVRVISATSLGDIPPIVSPPECDNILRTVYQDQTPLYSLIVTPGDILDYYPGDYITMAIDGYVIPYGAALTCDVTITPMPQGVVVTPTTPFTSPSPLVNIDWIPSSDDIGFYTFDVIFTNTYGIECHCGFSIRVLDECTTLPLDCVAWWTLEPRIGLTANEIVNQHWGHPEGNPLYISNGKVEGAVRFDGVDDYFWAHNRNDLNFSGILDGPEKSDFSIDAWVRRTEQLPHQYIVSKFDVLTSTGYAFKITDTKLELLASSGLSQTELCSSYPISNINDGEWHHVAVTVERNSDIGVYFYFDGQRVDDGYQGVPYASEDLSNQAPLHIGYEHIGPYDYYYKGELDEVEIFRRVLKSYEITAIYDAGSFGKCREFCRAPWNKPICKNQSGTLSLIYVCNYTGQDCWYELSFSTFSMVGFDGCNLAGPPTHQILLSPRMIPCNHCFPFPVFFDKTPQMISDLDVTCYAALFENITRGTHFGCLGSVQYQDRLCVEPGSGNTPQMTSISFGSQEVIKFTIANTDSSLGPTSDFIYEIIALPSHCIACTGSGGNDSICPISLNGLPPGAVVEGALTIPYGGEDSVSVEVAFVEHEPLTFYNIMIMADLNLDGVIDPLSTVGVHSVLPFDCNANGVPDDEDITSGFSDDLNGDGIPDECQVFPTIMLEKTHNALQGHYEFVSITLEDYELEMGGFDFLIAYDASALTFMEATPGQLLDDCGWEYFTYRYGVDGNCGDACPSGLLRIIAIADMNNGPNHPSCYGPPDTDPYELAEMKFYVTNDRTYECMYVPIRFFWADCGDNAISDVTGNILYISDQVYDFEGNEVTGDIYYGGHSWVGDCQNPDPDKPDAIPFLNFIHGGVDIVCADSIDRNGDLNLNNIPNEIADAVVYTNYFLFGPTAFHINYEAQVAASEVNNDGMPLTVGDLIYLIRIITGDALPYSKLSPFAQNASVNMLVNHSAVAVSTNSAADLGAAYFIFEHFGYEIGEPYLINGALDMTLKYNDEDGVLKVLVYSMEKGRKIVAGRENIFVIPITGDGSIDLTEIQMSDYYGNLLNSNIEKQPTLPKTFALHQNYPNPFNATTQISFEMPKAAHLKIEIFNIIGQRVITLFDGEQQAGVHTLEWNGVDHTGHEVASGIYLYRLTSDDFRTEKKMVLMK